LIDVLSAVTPTAGATALMRILMVEDEFELAGLLVERLRGSGFETDHAATLLDARAAIGARDYSLALLDRRLPDGDNIALVPDLQRSHPRARVVILTARDAVSDKIEGLDARADDHLAKPFDVDELMARVRARMRRGGEAATEPPVAIGALSCHSRAREVVVDGRPLSLRRRELLLLESLARRRAKSCSPKSMTAGWSRARKRLTRWFPACANI
jgi:two-component system OmpR family response regulator